MNRLYPADLHQFSQRYRLAGSRLQRLRIRYRGADRVTVEFVLAMRAKIRDLGTEPQSLKLKIRLEGVEEFRFQKRPTTAAGTVPEARIGYFGDMYFVNLDAWGLQAGEVPGIHDYRGSDAYVGARELYWEEVEAKPE